MSSVVELPIERIRRYCREQPIRRLSLFGSALRDDFGPDSDVDMLVEFEPDAKITLLDMSRMERELGQIIGRQVDLRTAEELHRAFRDEVRQQAEPVYAR